MHIPTSLHRSRRALDSARRTFRQSATIERVIGLPGDQSRNARMPDSSGVQLSHLGLWKHGQGFGAALTAREGNQSRTPRLS